MSEIRAASAWNTNAHLIEAVHELGYISDQDLTLDPTYGLGKWWKRWAPYRLEASDLDAEKSPCGTSVSFTDLPHADDTFDVVAFDPPYKLNGTPDPSVDARYGVDVVSRWQDRMRLCIDGITECDRVLKPGGILLVKCQDQVCSGQVRWQTLEFTNHAVGDLGMTLVDSLLMLGGRAQPKAKCPTCKNQFNGKMPGHYYGSNWDWVPCQTCMGAGKVDRNQVHARRNYSTLLVLRKGRE